MQVEVLVQLKGEVLDPEGRAIQETLKLQGISGLSDVRVAKQYVLTIDTPAEQALNIAERIASLYLANPVSQTFTLRKLTP
jgi:phosphoribosylformylglycinamidine synthase subunit PurS